MGTPSENDATSTDNNVDSTEKTIDWEKRFKDTQSAYTKSQQELKALAAKAEVLEKLTAPQVELDDATREELETLKFENPDAWRSKMNSLEQEAMMKHQSAINEASESARLQAEIERRAQVLSEFNTSHGLNITDEVIQYDVPPRITKKLEAGEISFEAYLNEVKDFLHSPKVVGDGNKTLNQPDLNKVGGDDKPSDGAVSKDIAKDYKNIVF